MGRFAAIVCTQQDDIARIERLVAELPGEVRVRVTMIDGRVLTGTVVERPALQLFEDSDGTEGFNAVLRIDCPVALPSSAQVWLSDIRAVERLD